MDEEPAKYECPVHGCGADMNEQVNRECRLIVDVPMLGVAGKAKDKGTNPESVSLQCPNGHWAEYDCPKASRGE